MIFSLASATKIIACTTLNADELSRIATCLSGQPAARILVIKDPRPVPVLDQAITAFLADRPGLILDRIVPNPQSDDIMIMASQARAFQPDLVLGIGGGSALDSAKAVRALVCHEGELDDYLGPQASRTLEQRGPKLVLVPTTTGTGSEVTKFGVYTSRSGRKFSLGSPLLQADAALLVSSLVADIPPALLAATAYDAITHALETLWNKNASPLSDLVASDALGQLLTWFPRAYEARLSGKDHGVTELLHAACAAGVAFNQTGTAAIHALSFVLSEEWHLPHGLACAFFTEDVFDWNVQDTVTRAKLAAVQRQRATIGQAAIDNASDEAVVSLLRSELLRLKKLAGLPCRFADIPAAAAQVIDDARIAQLFDKIQDDFKLKNNIRPLDIAAVRHLVGAKRA